MALIEKECQRGEILGIDSEWNKNKEKVREKESSKSTGWYGDGGARLIGSYEEYVYQPTNLPGYAVPLDKNQLVYCS